MGKTKSKTFAPQSHGAAEKSKSKNGMGAAFESLEDAGQVRARKNSQKPCAQKIGRAMAARLQFLNQAVSPNRKFRARAVAGTFFCASTAGQRCQEHL